MKTTMFRLCCGLFLAASIPADEGAQATLDVVKPRVPDKLGRVTLNQRELGGEINRRIQNLVYSNYLVLDLDSKWLNHFRNRIARGNQQFVYYGIGKVFDAGSLFAAYTGDPKVAARTQYIIDELVKSRDADGYVGFWKVEPAKDDSVRPNGLKAVAQAWLNQDRTGDKVAVTLTEFTDPSGRDVYFRVPNLADTSPVRLTDDEIVSWPNEFVNAHVLKAFYNCKNRGLLSTVAAGNVKPLNSQFKAFGSPLGHAYGLEKQSDELGFVSNYAPSDRQEDTCRNHYTAGKFDQVLSTAERNHFLYTHPISDTAWWNTSNSRRTRPWTCADTRTPTNHPRAGADGESQRIADGCSS
jgi:hypothetical protein